jgi:hypothetical protein
MKNMALRKGIGSKSLDEVMFFYWAVAEMTEAAHESFSMWLTFGQVVGEA